MPRLHLKNISKRFGASTVLQDINLEIADGEFIVLLGPSGCGKTTLLRILCGLEKVDSGEICIDDQVVNQLRPAERGVAMVFPNYALYPHMNVYDNMEFGLKSHRLDAAARKARIAEVATKLHIDHLLASLPHQLSDGQRQRVAIGRAMVRQPRIFLFDEPLAKLDPMLRTKTRLELSRLQREMRTTMVYVTHDQIEAMTLGDRIVVLKDGRLQQVAAPISLYQQPTNRFVASFIGSPAMNFLPARILASQAHGVLVQLHDGTQTLASVESGETHGETLVEIGFRPEHCYILKPHEVALPDGLNLQAEVVLVEHLGDSNLLHLRLADDMYIVARNPSDTSVRIGDTLSIYVSADSLYVFRTDGVAMRRLHPNHLRPIHVP